MKPDDAIAAAMLLVRRLAGFERAEGTLAGLMKHEKVLVGEIVAHWALSNSARAIVQTYDEAQWPSEARVVAIGQNGNTGEHYKVGYAGPTANWGPQHAAR